MWGNNNKRKEYKGKTCKLICKSLRMNSCLIEFENGDKLITSQYAIRLIK